VSAPRPIDPAGTRSARPTSLTLAEPVAPEVPVGARIAFKARVSCAEASDLRGGSVDLAFADAVMATQKLVECRDGFSETDAFAVAAPDRVGAFTWTLKFPYQEIGGIAYGQSALAISLATQPLLTSLAVWAVPSPVVMGVPFRVAVGAKSSGACALSGARVAILDECGATVGEGMLGNTPWPGTDALHWSEIGLTAPPREGNFSWRAAFAATGLALPHSGASATFSFSVVKRPEHCLTVKVIAGDAPVANVEVALGPYRAATDSAGMAVIEAPAGHYELAAWHSEFEAFAQPVNIARDGAVEVALTPRPPERTVWD